MQNYMHITIHTSQAWADTFISELMDTSVEMELRTKHIPPQVPCPALPMTSTHSHTGSARHGKIPAKPLPAHLVVRLGRLNAQVQRQQDLKA